MAKELYLNLKINGERFYWDSTWCELKKFVLDDLKLAGRWTSPGGEVKLFTSDNLSLKWHGKSAKWITVNGDPSATSELTKVLMSILKKAADCQDETSENCKAADVDEDKHNGYTILSEEAVSMSEAIEEATGISEVIDQTAHISLNTADRINKIETKFERLESKLMDKILTVVNDLNNLRKYCLDSGSECVDRLRQENKSLREENHALKDSLYIAKYTLSDLNSKVKDLENEKISLTTTLKILHQDSYQSQEYYSQQKDAIVGSNNNGLNKTESVMTYVDSKKIHSHSSLSDEPIIVPEDEGEDRNKDNLSKGIGSVMVDKTRKVKIRVDKRPQTLTHTPIQNSDPPGENSEFKKKFITATGDSIIKNVYNSKEITEANDLNPLKVTTEANKPTGSHALNNASDVNDMSDLNSTNVSVSERAPQNRPIYTTRFNNLSNRKAQTEKHLVPCPFLRRRGHCVKGTNCDFQHPVDSQRILQFDPSGFPSPFRKRSLYPGPLFPPTLFHPFMNQLYMQPFMQPLETLQPLMDIPTRAVRY